MTQFILIDHSLSELGGHHYQYAAQILAAAKQLGFETHLASGVGAGEIPTPDGCDHHHPLFPYPSYGKWSRLYDARKQLKQLDDRRWAKRCNPLRIATDLKLAARRSRRKQQFASACQAFFQRVDLQAGDHVFLPTCSEFDLLAFGRYLSTARPDHHRARWHVQFHVSFFEGRRCDQVLHRHRRTYMHRCLTVAKEQLSDFDVRFYTTTEQLAEHYNQLEVFDYRPLPYPAGSQLQSTSMSRDDAQPLRVLAAGKPRDEKGSHFLPALAAELQEDLLGQGRMQLIVQTPAPLPWAKTLNRNNRSRGLSDAIVQAPFPLDEARYETLLNKADIGLFLYDASEYYARASGVLAELLAKGKPVITPAGCWLAEQGGNAEEDYLENWRRRSRLNAPHAIHGLQRVEGAAAAMCESAWDEESAGVLWQCQCIAANAAPMRIEVQQQDREGAWSDAVSFTTRQGTATTSAYMTVPPSTPRLRIRAYPEDGAAGKFGVQIREYRAPLDMKTPRLGRHNLAATNWRSAARMLRDMADHYEHYLDGAREFAASWNIQHAPLRTVELLTERTAALTLARAA